MKVAPARLLLHPPGGSCLALRFNPAVEVQADAGKNSGNIGCDPLVAAVRNWLVICKLVQTAPSAANESSLHNIARSLVHLAPRLLQHLRQTLSKNVESDDSSKLRDHREKDEEEEKSDQT